MDPYQENVSFESVEKTVKNPFDSSLATEQKSTEDTPWQR